MFSIDSLCCPQSVVDVFWLAVYGLQAFCDPPVVDTRVGVLEAMLEICSVGLGSLELQIASEDAEIGAKVAKADDLRVIFEWLKKESR